MENVVLRHINCSIEIKGNEDKPYELCVFNEDKWKTATTVIEIGHPEQISQKKNPNFKVSINAVC